MTKRLPRIVLGGFVFCFIASVPSALAGQAQDVRLLKAENKLLKATIESRDKRIDELKEQVAELKTADAQKKIDALTKELAEVKEQLAALKGKAEEADKVEPAEAAKVKADPNAITFDKTTHRKIEIPEGMKWELAESPDEKPTGRMSAAYTLGPLPKGIDDKDALRFIAKGELDKSFKGRKMTKTLAADGKDFIKAPAPKNSVVYFVFYLASQSDQAVTIDVAGRSADEVEVYVDSASTPKSSEHKLKAGHVHIMTVKYVLLPSRQVSLLRVTLSGKSIYQGFVPTKDREAEPAKTVLD